LRGGCGDGAEFTPIAQLSLSLARTAKRSLPGGSAGVEPEDDAAALDLNEGWNDVGLERLSRLSRKISVGTTMVAVPRTTVAYSVKRA
jgi:hypothetical protein